jgi:hypothetical protein
MLKLISKKLLTCESAPRARLERATYCLGGTFPTSPDIAWCRLTSALAAVKIAGCSLMSPCVCGRWLPVWLPRDIVSDANVRVISAIGHADARPQAATSSVWPGRPSRPATPLTGYGFRDSVDAAHGTSHNRDQVSWRGPRRRPAAPSAGRSREPRSPASLNTRSHARSCTQM